MINSFEIGLKIEVKYNKPQMFMVIVAMSYDFRGQFTVFLFVSLFCVVLYYLNF